MNERAGGEYRERLFRLLPAVHRAFDARAGGPLHELLSLIAEQADLLEDDLARLYDNWFIETCDEWVVPYLGDLIGYIPAADAPVRPLPTQDRRRAPPIAPRREVANTLRYRRRKGSLALLEELAREVVGWPARGVEFRQLVTGAAAVNHLAVRRSSTVDVRDRHALARLGSLLDQLPRAVDVRRINSARVAARYNLPAVGLFVCRRKVYRATHVPAYAVDQRGRFTFDPFGRDVLLHIDPLPEEDPLSIAEAPNLPLPLTRELLAEDACVSNDARPRISARGCRTAPRASTDYYGLGRSLAICPLGGPGQPTDVIPANRVAVADLSNWSEDWLKPAPGQDPRWPAVSPLVAVDPQRGRLAFDPAAPPAAVWTHYHYGFASDLGGGEYDRQLPPPPPQARYYPVATAEAAGCFPSIRAAIQQWRGDVGGNCLPDTHWSLIEVVDNDNYDVALRLEVPAGQGLEIRAANCQFPLAGAADGRAVGGGTFDIQGMPGSRLVLSGVRFVVDQLRISGAFQEVILRDCTLTPGTTRLELNCPGAVVRIEHCLVGQIESNQPRRQENRAAEPVEAAGPRPVAASSREPPRLLIENCVLDSGRLGCRQAQPSDRGRPAEAIGGSHGAAWLELSLRNVTLLGSAHVLAIGSITNSICTERLCATNQQQGCLAYSYLPVDSRTPARHHCLPAEPVNAPVNQHKRPQRKAQRTATNPIVPHFCSVVYSHPDYARLADDCPAEMLAGADDQGELGVYHDEYLPRRAALLRARLAEFVPADCDANIIFET